MKLIIDASKGTVGRIASHAAKQALLGKEIVVVNCSQAILTGNREMILREYKQAMYRGGFALNGPFFTKRNPQLIVKRTIRGMLSYKQGRGEAAFARIRCYNDVPEEYAKVNKISLAREMRGASMPLSDLVKVV